MGNKKMFNRIMSAILAFAMVFSMVIPVSAAETDTWKKADSTEIFWAETEDSKSTDAELEEQVKLFASELAEKVTETALPISYGTADNAGDNDIVLMLDSTLEIAAQGYTVTIDGAKLVVSASDKDGLFYGCRYVIQQLLVNGTVSAAEEAPDVLERALSLDNGRKYYSVDWIKEMIRELSWANMNALVLHFSEEMGLGIESKTYPWLAGRDGSLCTQAEVDTDNTVLTQDEIKEIVEYANLYHVEIIPSFDSPGHMNYVVKMFNEKCATEDYTFTYNGKEYIAEAGSEIGNYYHYNGKTSIVTGSRNTEYSRGIDISNEVAVAFTKSLVEEYAKLFAELGCTKFDIGGDELLGWGSAIVSTSTASRWQQLDHWKEYAQNRAKAEGNANWENAVAYDGFMYYMNDMYDLVSELGYTSVRMWNDDALRSSDTGWNKVVELNTNIDIWFWATGANTVWTYATAGYQVYNILSDYNYYAMTTDYFSDSRSSFTQAYADEIYNEWTPFTFDPTSTTLGAGKNTAIGNPNILGSAFAIWSDNPTMRTEDEVMTDVIPLIRAHGAKAWDALENESVTYETFTANTTLMGDAPLGTVEAGDVTVIQNADKTLLEAAIAQFATVNAVDYTAASYEAYRAAVNAGEVVAADKTATQEVVDVAVAAINAAYQELAFVDGISDTGWFVQGAFKSSKVYVGKVATLSVSTIKNSGVASLLVYNENGLLRNTANEGDFVRYNVNTRNAARDIHTMIFTALESEVGEQTYRVYAVFEDGTRSSSYEEFTITVK